MGGVTVSKTVNHLKNKEQQRKHLAVAFGLQAVAGTVTHSKVEGTAPDHQIIAYNALGEGEWNACKGAYYKGEEIPAADYEFHPGAHATDWTTGAQTVDSNFPKDVPHSHTAAIGYKAPVGLGNADNAANPPNEFKGIFETKKSWDFESNGNLLGFSYSANPARCILETILSFGRLPNLPSAWASHVDYWLSRIDFGSLCAFRDFHNQTETVDYRTLPDFDGFGLRASYYSDTNLGGFGGSPAPKFVHPNFDINYGSQPPAANVAAGNFSGIFEGFIKFPYQDEDFTFYLTHDNGAKLIINGDKLIESWQDDGLSVPNTDTGVFNSGSFAGSFASFFPIELWWNDGGGIGNFKLEWESDSVPREVIPSKYLYPIVEDKPLYESHIYVENPISIAATIRQILFVSNSIMQDVNGKLRFFCLEQLTPSFALDNTNIDKFEFRRRDILRRDPFTEYEAQFKDLDSQYLEEPTVPVSVKLDIYARKTFENVKVVPLYNTTRWRARKVLAMRAKLEMGSDLLAEAETKMAKTYPVTAGDLISVTHRKVGAGSRTYLVSKTADSGVTESKDVQGTETEKRILTLQEWS